MSDQNKARIGVFICHCGTNIAKMVDIERLKKYATLLPNVVAAYDYKFMCSDPGQNLITESIKKDKLDRVVVAACSPMMHEKTFQKAIQRAGLNKYMLQIANIREHASWVHDDIRYATKKAQALLAGAVKRARLHEELKDRKEHVHPATLIIGGGIAGIQAALDIANSGNKVFLVERGPAIGGHMAEFDKTFPTLDCSACILTPKMVDVGRHENITLITNSQVESVDGFVGNYDVRIKMYPRYVDIGKCINCGECWSKCPSWRVKKPSGNKKIIHDSITLGPPTSIYIPTMQPVPPAPIIDTKSCLHFQSGKCGICANICPTQAIDYSKEEEDIDIRVGNIIVTTGYKSFDPAKMPQYGYGRYPNVLSAIEFERMNCASGSTGGEILMENGDKPKTIGFVHCVGSRDENFNEYCSRVCCMYALKYAHLAKEKTGATVYDFYIDMRCFGKGYEEFYNRMLREEVRFIRGKVASVSDYAVSKEEEGKLVVTVEDTLIGRVRRVPLDMLVLCTAIEAAQGAEAVSKLIKLCQGKEGFFQEKHPKLAPVSTAADGIFIAGCCQGPKDIPDTVAQASAAAAQVLSSIAQGYVMIEGIGAEINEELCTGCKICNNLCPYGAIEYLEDKKVSKVNEVLCKACGVCVSACPSGAIKAKHFTDEQIFSEIEGVLHE